MVEMGPVRWAARMRAIGVISESKLREDDGDVEDDADAIEDSTDDDYDDKDYGSDDEAGVTSPRENEAEADADDRVLLIGANLTEARDSCCSEGTLRCGSEGDRCGDVD